MAFTFLPKSKILGKKKKRCFKVTRFSNIFEKYNFFVYVERKEDEISVQMVHNVEGKIPVKMMYNVVILRLN